ncbi:bifunctional diguanylate cyclase/phosphodiesterase [Aliarcobacter cryaerophilus]|uniref:bifunctional diguanylate cyclase/phosphodiesterase n=1 Tax=Aliarcobacter cryaerophilus TaxID=28198 RepID=UPI0021B29711|nr:GGDEF domain-containing phosphodiesterase [Aliarcobacter cryaerophilus]MCT7513763.1 EAL domain-containing protein [Aliarcobacter cryaerophilus]
MSLTFLEYSLILTIIFLLAFLIIKHFSLRKLKSEQKELKRKSNILRQYNKATKSSNIISNSDLKGNITYVNDTFCEVSQYKREEIIGKPHNILRAEEDGEIFKSMWETIKSGNIWRGNLKNKKKDGTFYYINTTISPIFDENGEIFEYVAIRHEITDLVLKTEKLNRILREDYLTEIGSRYKLIEDISKQENLSISILDIKNFSDVNDFFGYKIGDYILKLVAKRIEELVIKKPSYSVYRLTSDVFAILASNESKIDFIKNIKEISKIISSKAIRAKGREVFVSINYTFSFEPKNSLLETANVMRKYTKSNPNQIIYDRSLEIEKDYEKNIFWTLKIKKALENNDIIPYYQAIYNLQTNKIEKYEALMRLNDSGKIVSPFFFLDIAKKSGQYLQLTKRMIDSSFEYFKDKDFEFSINFTFQDIANEEISNYVIEKIKELNIGNRVVFEIVESEEIDDFNLINRFFSTIRKLGCKIAIDDFGSGYSNFEYLIKLDADYIKIDGSLIKDVLVSKGNENIITMIINFAKDQGFKTIAEFVSSKEILEKVKYLGVDYVQGYYIHEPSDKIEN